MRVNIRQLRAFDAVVRAGSFAGAAAALHVSPAAVSLAIRELEDGLGFAVLARTTRSLRLTDAGRGYLPFVQRVLGSLEEAGRYAQETQRGQRIVRLATTQAIIAALLTQALPDVHRHWPDVQFHPLDVAAGGVAEALLRGEADMAIGVDLPGEGGFESLPVFRSRWHAFLAPSHALGRRRRLSWDELAGQRLFMTRSSTLKLQLALGGAVSFADAQDTTTAASGLAMASTGQGVALFPGYAQVLARVAGLKALPVQRPVLQHELSIACAREPATAAPLPALRDALRDAIVRRCGDLA